VTDTTLPDTSFFNLRFWRASSAEHEFVRKIYASNILTPRERRTLGVYHSLTYMHLRAVGKDHMAVIEQAARMANKEVESIIELESLCQAVVRDGWNSLDSLAHEINLVCWKQAGRQDLYHPYVQEKKITFYMVRQKLLASEKLRKSPVCELLDRETRDPKSRAESYSLLSNFAMRALHRPLLLGCRWNGDRIVLSENEGMPQDKAFSLQDVDILNALEQIGKWLESFVDQVYLALCL
jgi:hypothetical protein